MIQIFTIVHKTPRYLLIYHKIYFFIIQYIELKSHMLPLISVQSMKILLLPSKCEIIFLPFKNSNFYNIVIASFLYCFPYSYRSSDYCDSNSCRSFTLPKELAKTKGNLFAITFKSKKVRLLSLLR